MEVLTGKKDLQLTEVDDSERVKYCVENIKVFPVFLESFYIPRYFPTILKIEIAGHSLSKFLFWKNIMVLNEFKFNENINHWNSSSYKCVNFIHGLSLAKDSAIFDN